jgi:hypothetical protein
MQQYWRKISTPSLQHSRNCLRPDEKPMPGQSEGLCADVIDGGLAQEGGSTREAEFGNIALRSGPRSCGRHLDPNPQSRRRRLRCWIFAVSLRSFGALAAWENDKRKWCTSLEDTQALMTNKFPFIVLAWCVRRQFPAPTPERAHILIAVGNLKIVHVFSP